jgi:hypothetical protein
VPQASVFSSRHALLGGAKEPAEGQELYLSNGSGPWRVKLLEQVPGIPRSPYNILVVERIDH